MAGMRDPEPAFYAATVGHIYEAALDPRRWHDVLGAIDRIYPDARITLFGHHNGRPGANFAFRKNFGEDDLRVYFDHFIKNSPFLARVGRCPVGQPAYSEIMISDDELFRTEYYNDYMRSRRLGHYATGIVFERGPGTMTALSIADRKDDATRRSHQMRTLGILLPHLQRAMQLHRIVSRERTAAMATQTLFDRWTHAAFVLDVSGRMVSMNATAARLVEAECGVWLDRAGHLRLLDNGEGSMIEASLRRYAQLADSLDPDAADGVRDMFVLPRPAPQRPLQAMAWPLPAVDSMSELGGKRGRLLLVVFNPSKVERTPVGWLSRHYGLTHGETRLAEAIVNGVPLTDAAEQLGIQLSTARSRLKVILGKTSCGRQVELVRLALSLPPVSQS